MTVSVTIWMKSSINAELRAKLIHALFRPKEDIRLTDKVIFHVPTIEEVYNIGFEKYMQNVGLLTSVGMDLPLILDEMGEDFSTIDDFYLFCKYIAPSVSEDCANLLLPNLPLNTSGFVLDGNGECLALISNEKELLMTREIYDAIMFCLRFTHKRKRNDIIVRGVVAKEAYLEDAYYESLSKGTNDDDVPTFEDLISTMVNDSGFLYNYDTVFDMKIIHFLDAVYRSKQIHNTNLLLQSGYSGFGVDLKKINQKELNRFAPLEY